MDYHFESPFRPPPAAAAALLSSVGQSGALGRRLREMRLKAKRLVSFAIVYYTRSKNV